MIENFDTQVQNILKNEEYLLNFHISKKGNSCYFLIIKGEGEYLTFRVSDHSTNAFYSSKTFNSRKDLDELLSEIRTYLDTASWYVFKYEDYFSLKVLSQVPFESVQFYIDNTMGIFDRSLTGLVFYQSREFGRNHKEFNIVSESFQKELRKLFASGLISDHREGKDDILLYINSFGKSTMDYTEEKYINRFKEDEKDINYRYIEVPGD